MGTVGRPSPSLILIGNGVATTAGSGGGGGVEVFFLLDDCVWGICWGVASEARLFAAGSRRSRAGSLRFSAMAIKKDGLLSDVKEE